MGSRERVFAALERRQPDRIPILEWVIDPKVIDVLSSGCSYLDFIEKIELDGVSTNESNDFRTDIEIIDEKKGLFKDKWNVTRRFTTEAVAFPMKSPIRRESDLRKCSPPDPRDERLFEKLYEAVKRFKGRKAIIWLGHDAFILPSYLRGMENLLADYVLNPDFAHKVTEMCVAYNIEEVRRAVEIGAEVVMLSDDYACKRGPLMSPAHFREFVLPGLKRVVEAAKDVGAYVVKHTDGNVWPILDMIIESAIDGINPLEPTAGMDIGEVKTKYGDRVCVVGNIDCSYTLTQRSVEDVCREVEECISKASPGGGHIMSSSNSIHSGVRPENYRAMIEATRKYGNYPLHS